MGIHPGHDLQDRMTEDLTGPEMFFAVGEWYHDFSATSDEEVADLLREAAGVVATARETKRSQRP